jgi:hypothetical protein
VAGPEEAAVQYDRVQRGEACELWIKWSSSPQISTDLPGGLSSATPGLWHGTISEATSGLVRLSTNKCYPNVLHVLDMWIGSGDISTALLCFADLACKGTWMTARAVS